MGITEDGGGMYAPLEVGAGVDVVGVSGYEVGGVR